MGGSNLSKSNWLYQGSLHFHGIWKFLNPEAQEWASVLLEGSLYLIEGAISRNPPSIILDRVHFQSKSCSWGPEMKCWLTRGSLNSVTRPWLNPHTKLKQIYYEFDIVMDSTPVGTPVSTMYNILMLLCYVTVYATPLHSSCTFMYTIYLTIYIISVCRLLHGLFTS